jgi:hypothetical protein
MLQISHDEGKVLFSFLMFDEGEFNEVLKVLLGLAFAFSTELMGGWWYTKERRQ